MRSPSIKRQKVADLPYYVEFKYRNDSIAASRQRARLERALRTCNASKAARPFP